MAQISSSEVNSDEEFEDQKNIISEKGMNLIKCGEISLLKPNNFILICGFCNKCYHKTTAFGEHILIKHFGEEDVLLSDQIIKDYVRAEDSIVIEKLDSTESQYFDSKTQRQDRMKEEIVVIDESDFTDEVCDASDVQNSPAGNDAPDHINQGQRQSLNAFQENSEKGQEYPCTCQYCDKNFNDNNKLESHEASHVRDRPYTCHHCQKSFTTKSYRQHHIKIVHMGHKPHKCTECSSSFGTRGKLRAHMLTHSMPGVYSCDICERQFIHESRKKAHMRTHTGEKPFQCEYCGEKYILRSRLTEHMKRHTNTKNHKCDICDKRFYTNVMLKHHLVSHSSDKPFKCPDCGRAFSRKKVMKIHCKIHSDVKQYSCDICGKEFSQFAGLYSHKKSHGKKLAK